MISDFGNEQRDARKFFHRKDMKSNEIKDFYFGFIELALKYDFIVVLCLDEMQYLSKINSALQTMVLNKFVRRLFEKFAKKFEVS